MVSESTSLLSPDAAVQRRTDPTLSRKLAGAAIYLFILLDRWWGMIGLSVLSAELALIIVISTHIGWFAGSMAMVACFSTSFCFGTASAARGNYSRAAPFLLVALVLIAGGVLGSHFFIMFDDTFHGQSVREPNGQGIPLAAFMNHTFPVTGNFVYLADGNVRTDIIGETQFCKHKLPVIGSCINRYYCVSPIVPEGWHLSQPIPAWAAVDYASSCTGPAFLHSSEYRAWKLPYRKGVGIEPNSKWTKAIQDAIETHSVKSINGAPLLNWVEDPLAERRWAWQMGWMIVGVCFLAYMIVLTAIGGCAGWAEEAYPGYRAYVYGADDRVVQRFKKKQGKKSKSKGDANSSV